MAELNLNKQSLTLNVAKTDTITVTTDNDTFTAKGDEYVSAVADVAKKTITVKGLKEGTGKVIATINYKETVEVKGELTTVPYSEGLNVAVGSYVTYETKTYKALEAIEATTNWETDGSKFEEITDIEAEKPVTTKEEDRTKTAECTVTVNPQLKAELTIDNKTHSIKIPKTATVKIATNGSYTTAIDNNNVEVNKTDTGITIKALKEGKSVITVTASKEDCIDTVDKINVTVLAQDKTELTIDNKTPSVKIPKEVTINVTTNGTFTAKADNSNVTLTKTDSTIVIKAAKVGNSVITVTASKTDCLDTVEKINVTVLAQDVTELSIDKESVSVKEGKSDTVNVTTNADDFTVTKNNDNINFTKKNKVITISGVTKGTSVLTIEATATDSVKATKKINITVEEKSMTQLSLSKQTVDLKVNETSVVNVTTDAASFTANGDDKIQVTPDVAKKTITVKAIAVGTSTLTVEAQKEGDEKNTATCTFNITKEAEKPNPPVTPSTTVDTLPNFRKTEKFGWKNLPSKENAMKEYLEKVKDFTNSSNLKLNSMLKVTVVDKIATGTYTKSLFCKEIITLVINDRIANIKFINQARAKSFIALVRDLKESEYGSNINDEIKYKIIKYVVDGQGLDI